MEVSKHN